MSEILVYIVAVSAGVAFLGLSLATVITSRIQFWPPPSAGSWQHKTIRGLFRVFFVGLVVLSVMTFDTHTTSTFQYAIGIPLLVVGFGLALHWTGFLGWRNAFGEAGHRVVIEEFLFGEEASFIVMVDGKNILPLATSQDHKARDNGDTGPNTGGMGAYSPAPVVTQDIHDRVMAEVIRPTVDGMAKEGNDYTGFLYAGLMIDQNGIPKVLEYNCRFGDPETQPIMMRLQSDLVALCDAAIDGKLDQIEAQWDPRASLGIVMAAGGYPASYNKGDVISGFDNEQADAKVFHAGTALNENNEVVTNGGRVLCVTALGDTVSSAQALAYDALKRIQWQDAYYRTDIGHRAIARETSS